ncbi:hypothetical protein J416_11582 [Gracilibacillus halophilus YIM-C55.5]|uniref:DUF4083 domain-containing protein n=1 Tax=Gracilibacillus halophilus YIM-C55.5 TaxID=1308866 RepID=N4WP76_9BACI|nr:hypothetical protein [Gracilibacillus halophilus]ENH96290.1 hypothetical protein J416_11582 [Gracilibacillus halophilus YIM-C55.5]
MYESFNIITILFSIIFGIIMLSIFFFIIRRIFRVHETKTQLERIEHKLDQIITEKEKDDLHRHKK